MADTVTGPTILQQNDKRVTIKIVVQSDGTGGTTVFGDVSALTADDDGNAVAHLSLQRVWWTCANGDGGDAFAIDDIIEESFQRIGFDNITGYQMKSARRSLNIMFQEWGNRGLHYWEIDETNIDLVEGQAEYHFFRSAADDTSDSNRAQATTNQVASTIFGIDDVLESTYRTNRTQTTQQDVAMTKINRSTYSGLSNKLSKGQPTQYYVQRLIDRVTVFVYPTPDTSAASADMHIYFVKRIQDAGDFTNASDVPYRFVPCMTSGLSFYLAQKYRPELSQQMKLYYEDEFNRALTEDGSSTSTHITPQAYYPNV
jgi:hypothetical protein